MFPTLSPRERQAVTIYDDRVRRGDLSDTRVWADTFMMRIFRPLAHRADAEVVDVGCRIGRSIALLPDLGINRYFGVDPSAESIDYCQRTFGNIPGFGFAVSEIRLLGRDYPERFSGFLLLAVLMHIPREDLVTALASLRASLRTGAPGEVSTPVARDGMREVENPSGMLLTLYTAEELETAFTAAGFRVETIFSHNNSMLLGHVVAA